MLSSFAQSALALLAGNDEGVDADGDIDLPDATLEVPLAFRPKGEKEEDPSSDPVATTLPFR